MSIFCRSRNSCIISQCCWMPIEFHSAIILSSLFVVAPESHTLLLFSSFVSFSEVLFSTAIIFIIIWFVASYILLNFWQPLQGKLYFFHSVWFKYFESWSIGFVCFFLIWLISHFFAWLRDFSTSVLNGVCFSAFDSYYNIRCCPTHVTNLGSFGKNFMNFSIFFKDISLFIYTFSAIILSGIFC